MATEGVHLQLDDCCALAAVDYGSHDVRALLHAEMSAFCFGPATVEEEPGFYSFDETVKEFLELYQSKAPTTKTGIAGELAAHIALRDAFPDLRPASVLFNLEERSVKKGFDLVRYGTDQQGPWFVEVKSSDSPRPRSKSRSLVALTGRAAKHLVDKFEGAPNRKLWDNAIMHAGAALNGDEKTTVRQLLRADFNSGAENIDHPRNVVLVAVCFGKNNAGVPQLGSAHRINTVKSGEVLFAEVRVLWVDQEQVDDAKSWLESGAVL